MAIKHTAVSYYGLNYVEHAIEDFKEMIEHGCDTVILAITDFDMDFWFPNINEIVKEDDTLYILGDLMLNDNEYGMDCLHKIICKNIYIILGNHDTSVRAELYSYLPNGDYVVGFGDRDVIVKDVRDMSLGYAITVHKSQGSEYPAVIMPLLSGPRMLFNRNLLYTGVTRAKNCVTILGSSETVRSMIANESENKRYTSLNLRILELKELEDGM